MVGGKRGANKKEESKFVTKPLKQKFKLTEEQRKQIKSIVVWEKFSRESNVTIGGYIEY